jgi:hypothetical protein
LTVPAWTSLESSFFKRSSGDEKAWEDVEPMLVMRASF